MEDLLSDEMIGIFWLLGFTPMVKSCYSCTFREYHPQMRGGPPGGDAPEPAWFRCQAGHGTFFDAYEVDQRVADGFNCEDWTPDPR